MSETSIMSKTDALDFINDYSENTLKDYRYYKEQEWSEKIRKIHYIDDKNSKTIKECLLRFEDKLDFYRMCYKDETGKEWKSHNQDKTEYLKRFISLWDNGYKNIYDKDINIGYLYKNGRMCCRSWRELFSGDYSVDKNQLKGEK